MAMKMSARRKAAIKSAVMLLSKAARKLKSESMFGPYSVEGEEAYTMLLQAMDGIGRQIKESDA